jgi:hypothetical protein
MGKAAWLLFGALALGVAYAVYRGQQRATARRAVGCAFDCAECASGNVISCVKCGACASYL